MAPIYQDLIANVALLLTLSILYSFVNRRWQRRELLGQIVTGLVFGGVAIAGMMVPFHYGPGIIFDGRSIVVSMAGLFGGWLPALIAAGLTSAYRLWLGGTGAPTGVGVTVIAAALGLAYHYLRQRRPGVVKPPHLFAFGVLVHASMLLAMLTLPAPLPSDVLNAIALPIMAIFPLGTLLLGSLLVDQEQRNQMAEALRESEARYRSYVDHAPDGVFVADERGRYVEVNDAACRITGYSRADLLDMDIPGLMPPEAQAAGRQHFQQTVETGQASSELPFLHRDGTQRYWSVDAARLSDTRFLGFVSDITARKQAEARERRLLDQQIAVNQLALALGESHTLEEVYYTIYSHVRELMDAHTFIVSFCDDETRLIRAAYIIDSGEEFDVSSLPPVPLNVEGGTQSRVYRTGKPLYTQDHQQAKSTCQVEYNILDDGTLQEGPLPEGQEDIRRSALYVPMKIEGQAIGVLQLQSRRLDAYTQPDIDLLCALANVAAVAIRNAQLLTQTQEQARQIREIIDAAPEGVLLLDEGQRVVLANLLGAEDLMTLAGAQVGDTLMHLGGRSLAELLVLPAAGQWHEVTAGERVFELLARPLAGGSRGPEGWVLAVRDMTLARRVQQRIQEQERLAAVGQLAAGIAHDFNNLLTGIIGFAQLLQIRPDMPTSAGPELEYIVQGGQQAAHLIRQILDFGRKSLRAPQLLDLSPFLKETHKFLERTIPERVHITLEIGPGAHVVHADPTQIQQVLTNLAVNARDAMPIGGELRLGLYHFELQAGDPRPLPGMAPGQWAVLTVTDTGMGIPPDVLLHIYEPFFTTKPVGEGSGLGLAQVYGIVRQHEGYIDVATRVGVGTTFTVYLPAAHVPGPVVAVPASSPTLTGQGETILLVEDEPTVRYVLQATLEYLGYQVLVAANGQEALALYAQHQDRIALVLTDMVMPGMSGQALLQELQAQAPHLKAIMMTGYTLGQSDALQMPGLAAWIQKPLDRDKLMQILRRVLDG
ncbi:MAG: PAS domain S-box protein [Chloroflexi bacterium]|nr:PAS domain S-box protein [Chloroflexota bacterium]MBU1749623.1 PAS domain S-box protein [Chloroflexota bacterium]